jgi:hypothetical protein
VVPPTRGEPGWVMAIAGEPTPDPPPFFELFAPAE